MGIRVWSVFFSLISERPGQYLEIRPRLSLFRPFSTLCRNFSIVFNSTTFAVGTLSFNVLRTLLFKRMCLSVELENTLASRKHSVPITARWLVYRFRKLIQSFNLCTAYMTHDCSLFVLFSVALRPNADHGLLILEVSWSHTTTHHSR